MLLSTTERKEKCVACNRQIYTNREILNWESTLNYVRRLTIRAQSFMQSFQMIFIVLNKNKKLSCNCNLSVCLVMLKKSCYKLGRHVCDTQKVWFHGLT